MSIVGIVHLHSTADSLVSTGLNGRLECVGVVEVLHGLTAQVDAELLQRVLLEELESVHVEQTDVLL